MEILGARLVPWLGWFSVFGLFFELISLAIYSILISAFLIFNHLIFDIDNYFALS